MELEFHQLDLRYEALRARRPSSERRLLASLAEGQRIPIVVVELAGEPGRYVVIDGYKRIRALKLLRRDLVMATEWSLSETDALILDRSFRSSEPPTALEQGWLVRTLHEGHGLSGDELRARFGRSPSWVSRHLALVRELPSSVQDHVRAGRIPAQAAMKYLVPMCRARCEDACALAEAAARERLSARDVGELYQAWQTAGAPVRERLIAEPALFLRSRRELTRQDSPVPSPASEKLRRDLELIGVPDGPCARCGQVPQAIPIYPRLLLLRSPTSRASNALSRRPLQAMLNHSQSFCCVQAHLDLPRPSPTSPDSGSQSGGRRFDPGAVHQT